MYGYLRPEGRHGRTALQRQQCALCHAYKRGYSQRARLLAGYDPSTLLMLMEALLDTPPERVRVRCPLPPFYKRRATDPEWPAARAVAALQLFLAGEKLFDDRVDADGRLTALAERTLRADIAKAEIVLREAGFDVDSVRSVLRSQSELESDPCIDLDALTFPTRHALRHITGFAARAAECGPREVKTASDFGADLGSAIYLVDALADVRRDLAQNAFNPITHLTGQLTPRSLRFLLDLFEGRIHALQRSFEALPLRRHHNAIQASTLDSLEKRGRAALAALPAPHTALKLAGVIAS